MKNILRFVCSIAFFIFTAPPVAVSLLFAYNFVLTKHLSSRKGQSFDGFFGAILASWPELGLVAGIGGLVFTIAIFVAIHMLSYVPSRLMIFVISAVSLASPFLLDGVIKVLQGYSMGQHAVFFIGMGLSVGACIGIIFPKNLLPIFRKQHISAMP